MPDQCQNSFELDNKKNVSIFQVANLWVFYMIRSVRPCLIYISSEFARIARVFVNKNAL